MRPLGRLGFLAIYLGLIIASLALLDRYGDATIYALVVFTLGIATAQVADVRLRRRTEAAWPRRR